MNTVANLAGMQPSEWWNVFLAWIGLWLQYLSILWMNSFVFGQPRNCTDCAPLTCWHFDHFSIRVEQICRITMQTLLWNHCQDTMNWNLSGGRYLYRITICRYLLKMVAVIVIGFGITFELAKINKMNYFNELFNYWQKNLFKIAKMHTKIKLIILNLIFCGIYEFIDLSLLFALLPSRVPAIETRASRSAF